MTAGPDRAGPPPTSPHRHHDLRRAEVLRQLAILDTAAEAGFDGLAEAARQLSGCPIALVSLLDVNHQWFKSHLGLNATETPIEWAFCRHAVEQPGLFEVEDALLDPRFADNPLVTGGPTIRFYAGQPLTLEGVPLGTLCVIDTQPRRLPAPVRLALAGLARAAEGLLASRQAMVLIGDQRRRLTDIARASGDWLWECDADGRVTWSETLGAPPRPDDPLAIGRLLPDGELVDLQGAPLQPPASLHQRLAQRERFSRATVRWGIAEPPIFLSFSAQPRYSAAGDFEGHRGTVRDVSEAIAREVQRFSSELAMRLERDAAEQAVRLRSEVVSRVSHELRTPLNAMVGFAQLLQRSPRDVPLYATHIERAGAYLLALVDDLLKLARLESGHGEVELRPVASEAVMQRCIDLLQPEARSKGIVMALHVGPGAEAVLGDLQALTQALLNFAGNALKFSDPGGVVQLSADCAGPDRVRFAVTDAGPGIDPALLPLLFQPFSQLPGARRTGGTGLGLAISRQLVQTMGGEIGVESVVGAGSVFSLTLPTAPTVGQPVTQAATTAWSDTALDPVAEAAAPVGQRLLAVLYIEDDPINVILLEHMLDHLGGVTLQHAPHAAAGRRAAVERDFDLILLDMNLPDAHGLEVLRALRADRPAACVPVVAFSADALPESIEAARVAGFDDYLTKPIDIDHLRRVLARLR